jgi:hypothetical protein
MHAFAGVFRIDHGADQPVRLESDICMMIQKAPSGTKFCVFCGGAPSAKNKEHVVPRWLLELTGGVRNRRAYFGRQWSSAGLEKRTYPWQSFTFPACESCNTRWSRLEGAVTVTMQAMIEGSALGAADLVTVMDWFDKLRVGLWLGMYYLNTNYRSIIPQFHIDDRVRAADRALLIYKASEPVKGISMVGIDSPIFHSMPSVMYFVINQFHFISLSKPYLLAERFGWPTLNNARAKDIDTDGFFADLVPGTGKVALAILDTLPQAVGTALFQPIAPHSSRDDAPYAERHVIETSQAGEKGLGKLFIGNEHTSPYPAHAADPWKPNADYAFHELSPKLAAWTASIQETLFLDLPDFSHFPEADRKRREAEIDGIVKIHRLMVAHDLGSSSSTPSHGQPRLL